MRPSRVALVGCALASLAAAATPPEFAPAVAAAGRGEHRECARLFDAIAGAAEQRGLARRARYGEAVCATLGGDRDRAFAALAAALALDLHDSERFYDDPRLQPLRSDPRWPALELRFHEAVERWRAGLQPALHELYLADQQDRSQGPAGVGWREVAPRDRDRVRRVRELLAQGGELGADDLYHAAMVLQHGETRADFERAHELARRAAELDADHPGARWLAAAALDRALVAAGEPQRYGTQSILEDGRWVLAPVDPAVSDEERDAWDVPPLAESLARVAAMGAAPPRSAPAAASASASDPSGER